MSYICKKYSQMIQININRAAGDYGFALGDDAETLGPVVKVRMGARRWKD